jgi:hypothetical protein
MNITVFADGWSHSFMSQFTEMLNKAGTHRFEIFKPYENETIPAAERLEINGLDYEVEEVGKYDLAVYYNDSQSLFNNITPGSSVARPEDRLISYLMHIKRKLLDHVSRHKSRGMLVFQPIKADRIWASMVMRAAAMPVISLNPEPFPGFYWLDDGAPQHTGFLSSIENWHRMKRCKFTEIEEEEYARWLTEFKSQQRTRGQDWLDPKLNVDLTDERPFILIIGQMRTDANQTMYQRFIRYCPDILVHHIAAIAPDYAIYYKPHPLEREQDKINWCRLPGVKDRVTVIDQKANLHPYLAAADRVFTWNSNAGIEALAYHKPLAVLGEAFYRGKGFTYDMDYLLDDSLHNFIHKWKPDTKDIDQYLKYMVARFLIKHEKDYFGDRLLERINAIMMDSIQFSV